MPQTATSCGGTRSRWVSTSPQNPMTTAATPLASGAPAPNALSAQNVVQASAPALAARPTACGRAWLARDQKPAIPADAASATGTGTEDRPRPTARSAGLSSASRNGLDQVEEAA